MFCGLLPLSNLAFSCFHVCPLTCFCGDFSNAVLFRFVGQHTSFVCMGASVFFYAFLQYPVPNKSPSAGRASVLCQIIFFCFIILLTCFSLFLSAPCCNSFTFFLLFVSFYHLLKFQRYRRELNPASRPTNCLL